MVSVAGVAGFEPTNDGVRGVFEGKISSDLPKNPRSNSDGFTANSMKNTLKMPDFCFSFSVTHFCNTSQHFPNIRSRNKALPFHARRCQCCHTSRVCSEEYAFFIVCNNNRKIVFLIELAHVVIPVRFQSGDDLGELRLGAPMDSTLLHKNPLCGIKHKRYFYVKTLYLLERYAETERADRRTGRKRIPERAAFRRRLLLPHHCPRFERKNILRHQYDVHGGACFRPYPANTHPYHNPPVACKLSEYGRSNQMANQNFEKQP